MAPNLNSPLTVIAFASVIARLDEIFADHETVYATPYFSFSIPPNVTTEQIAEAFPDGKPHRHSIRLFLDGNTGAGRLRLHVPSGPQSIAAWHFWFPLSHDVRTRAAQFDGNTMATLNLLIPACDSWWFANNMCKEADVSWIPASRNAHIPSVVAEVGYNQSIPELRRDASEWFQLSTEIKLVILIKISGPYPSHRKYESMHLEFWERDATTGTHVPSPALPPLTWQSVDDVTALAIPATYFFDDPLPAYFEDGPAYVSMTLEEARDWFELAVLHINPISASGWRNRYPPTAT
ncbi:hypothetical protein DFH06DRAFT_1414093 [Mycena polygramma]|nr:hypothetical protein DFH06DRAFT_1414093 [Mycena polygramma]